MAAGVTEAMAEGVSAAVGGAAVADLAVNGAPVVVGDAILPAAVLADRDGTRGRGTRCVEMAGATPMVSHDCFSRIFSNSGFFLTFNCKNSVTGHLL